MTRICLIALFAATGLGLAVRAAPAQGLRAGVAACEVTPPLGCLMWGYGDREGVAQSVHDPLLAKVLALATDEGSLAIVTLDLGRCFDEDLRQMIEQRAAKAGIEHVIIVASHTHQGPDMEARDWPSAQAPWQDEAAHKVAEAVAQAAANMQPALIGFGTGEVDLAHNRRLVLPDGSVRMFWRNEKREPTSPVDRTVRVLRVDSAAGEPIALVVNYACHPVVLGPDNLMLSADYVGAMRQAVEAQWGGQCLFAQGACGDINPYMDKTPLDQGGLEEMQKMGQALAQEVLRIAGTIKPAPLAESRIVVLRRVFDLESRWEMSPAARQAMMEDLKPYIEKYGEERVRAYVERLAKGASVPVTAAVLSGQYALCAFPGEFFVEHQLDLVARSPVPATMFFGYADGYAGYFPTIKAAVEGGYGANYSTSVEVGAGERMVDYAVISILKATGKLRPLPAPEVPDYPEKEAQMETAFSLDAWFQGLPDSFHADAAGDLEATYYFHVTGPGGGDYAITIADGKCKVERAKPEAPDLTVTIADTDMGAIARGEADPTALFFAGKLTIDGDISLAMKMRDLFF